MDFFGTSGLFLSRLSSELHFISDSKPNASSLDTITTELNFETDLTGFGVWMGHYQSDILILVMTIYRWMKMSSIVIILILQYITCRPIWCSRGGFGHWLTHVQVK